MATTFDEDSLMSVSSVLLAALVASIVLSFALGAAGLARMVRALRHTRPGVSRSRAFLQSSLLSREHPLAAYFQPEGETLMRGGMRLVLWQLLALGSAVAIIFYAARS
jgi:hypothetical protein